MRKFAEHLWSELGNPKNSEFEEAKEGVVYFLFHRFFSNLIKWYLSGIFHPCGKLKTNFNLA